jgi:aminoglycoside phosphotransferase family enzyme
MNNNAYTWTNDFSGLCEKYAEFVMDSMDMKTMEQFVFDSLYESFSTYDEDQLIDEIRECYGDEVLEGFGIEIKEVPDSVTPD